MEIVKKKNENESIAGSNWGIAEFDLSESWSKQIFCFAIFYSEDLKNY